MEQHAFQKWREKLFAMKRDWLDFIAEAEARGAGEEACLLRAQLQKIEDMIAPLGGDTDANPPRRFNS